MRALGRIDPYFASHVIIAVVKTFCEELRLNFDSILNKSENLMVHYKLATVLLKLKAKNYIFDKERYTKTIEELRNISDIQYYISYSQIVQDKVSLYYLEMLLVNLLSAQEINIKNLAIIYLNTLYSGLDWEFTEVITPTIVSIGSYFHIREKVTSEEVLKEVIIVLTTPYNSLTIFSWYSVLVEANKGYYIVEKTFDKFKQCGSYYWRIVVIDKAGNIKVLKNAEGKNFVQGKFIVQPQDIANQQVHEINLKNIKLEDLSQYAKGGITSICIKGSPFGSINTFKIDKNYQSGKNKMIAELVNKCKESNLKVFVDFSICLYIEQNNGVTQSNEKSLKEIDHLLDNVLSFIKKYNIDGLYLSNNQFWFQAIRPSEVPYQVIGTTRSSDKDWDIKNTANPILIKISKKIWSQFPQLYLISSTENIQGTIRSGFIPHLLKIPITSRSSNKPNEVSSLKAWYENERRSLPLGSFILQSVNAHSNKIPMFFLLPEIPVTHPNQENVLKGEVNVVQDNLMQNNVEQEVKEETKGLLKCDKHEYNILRKLRHEKTVLRYGELVILNIDSVFAFARVSYYEIAIIVINLREIETTLNLNLSKLMPYFTKYHNAHTIVTFTNWLKEQPKEHHFLIELIKESKEITLPAFGILCEGFQICKSKPITYLNCLEQSFYRLNSLLLNGKDCTFMQPCQELLFSVESNQSLNDFSMILANLYKNYLNPYKISINKLIKNAESLAKLFAYSKKILACSDTILLGVQSAVKAAKELVDNTRIGPIVFVTPELGKWSAVGGLGIMIDELSQDLALLGEDVHVITPYYHNNRHNEAIYSNKNIKIKVADINYTIQIYKVKVNNVKIVFLYNKELFPSVYSEGDAAFILTQITVFAKAVLEYLLLEHCIPSIVATNDWYTGLVSAYRTEAFKSSTFIHICHNLQEHYEGRLYPKDDTLEHIHGLPLDLLVDSSWDTLIINLSRCAILCSDQWATVSYSYREELLSHSPLSPLLKRHPKPFAFPNGVPVKNRLMRLRKEGEVDHESAKKKLQIKYFNRADPVPVLSFIGRIVTQKGVHLICDIAEQLINKYKGEINILVGGTASRSDAYSSQCACRLEKLTKMYPNSFWASPDEFCSDGPLINLGSDFGMMPSLFEPGGIVQHEYFLAGTPVIAFKTGGLKDAVTEFSWETNTGNGFLFESYTKEDFKKAIDRALRTFFNKEKYGIVRKNAEKSAMDSAIVAQEWCKEFYRLKNKLYVNKDTLRTEYERIEDEWDYTTYNDDYIDEYVHRDILRIDLPEKMKYPISKLMKEWMNKDLIKTVFKVSLQQKAKGVMLAGSFNEWSLVDKMHYDKYSNIWHTELYLKRGKYL